MYIKTKCKPWTPVAQLVRASSRCVKVAGSIPGQGTYKNQPVMRQYVEQHINVSLSLKSINQSINFRFKKMQESADRVICFLQRKIE